MRLRLIAVLAAAPTAVQPQAPRDLAIAHASVIDVRDGRIATDQTLIVSGSRITQIGPSGSVMPPAGAQTVDARGAFVIPGLWEMHAHSYGNAGADVMGLWPLELANGITGVRIMWGNPGALSQRAAATNGPTFGPRLVVGSPLVDGAHPMWGGSVAVGDAARARQVVDSFAEAHYDFIKVYEYLSRDAFSAAAAQAKTDNIPFAGHLPVGVSAAEASNLGMRSFEHGVGITLACSSREDAVRRDLVAAMNDPADTGFLAHAVLFWRVEVEPLATFDAARCDALYRTLAANGTRVVPTLALWNAFVVTHDPATPKDPRLKYLPPAIRDGWTAAANSPSLPFSPAAVLAQIQRLTTSMRRAGVEILAGTDALNPFVYPGFSLHDELALLVQGGLSPLEALQAATLAPARFLGATDSLGTVERGKVADLVMLDANPLVDIHNTTRIRAVVANGRLYTRSSLDSLLANVERAVAGPGR
jgi:imidazolonepropionase-like amidohydrolase